MTQGASIGIKKFLRTLAPDFCFCTAHDLLLMMEQLDEDVDHTCFAVSLSQECKAGRFERKEWPRHVLRRSKFPLGLYRRISA